MVSVRGKIHTELFECGIAVVLAGLVAIDATMFGWWHVLIPQNWPVLTFKTFSCVSFNLVVAVTAVVSDIFYWTLPNR